MRAIKDIERLCNRYRKGWISENEFRLELAKHLLTIQPIGLNIIAERLEYKTEEGGDG